MIIKKIKYNAKTKEQKIFEKEMTPAEMARREKAQKDWDKNEKRMEYEKEIQKAKDEDFKNWYKKNK